MACGHLHASGDTEVQHGEGDHWCGNDVREDHRLDALGRHHPGGVRRERIALVPCVEPDHDALRGGIGDMGQQMVGQPRRGLANEQSVHPVRAGTDGAAKAGGAKGKAGAKSVRQALSVIRGQQIVRLLHGVVVGIE